MASGTTTHIQCTKCLIFTVKSRLIKSRFFTGKSTLFIVEFRPYFYGKKSIFYGKKPTFYRKITLEFRPNF